MRILITGASGQVGRALSVKLAGLGQIIAADRSAFDLLEPEHLLGRLDAFAPDLIVNAAAYTAVDKAETERDLAYKVNAEAVGAIGRWAALRQTPVIHFSTDYVFDGESRRPYEETDAVNPLSVYGASKAMGEELLIASGAPALIIRTAWVYAAEGKNFLQTMLRLAREKEELRIVDDQIGTPTSARQIARFMATIIRDRQNNLAASLREAGPIIHFTAEGETSWHGFASAIIAGLRDRGVALAVRHVRPIPTSEYPTPAKRPRYSRLATRRAREVFGFTPEPWRTALDDELQRLTL